MTAMPSSFAVDYGKKFGDRFFDVRWMSKNGDPPSKRWFSSDDILPDDCGNVFGFGTVDDLGNLIVNFDFPNKTTLLNDAINLWFVLVDARISQPSHFVLLAYADNTFPNGTVIEAPDAGRQFDDSYLSNWVSLINWRSGDPMLQQITVSPVWRRRHLAVRMIYTADIVNGCYGFSPGLVLHGGAITTDEGENLRGVFPSGSDRVDPRMGYVRISG